jgi:hypothetical protein
MAVKILLAAFIVSAAIPTFALAAGKTCMERAEIVAEYMDAYCAKKFSRNTSEDEGKRKMCIRLSAMELKGGLERCERTGRFLFAGKDWSEVVRN